VGISRYDVLGMLFLSRYVAGLGMLLFVGGMLSFVGLVLLFDKMWHSGAVWVWVRGLEPKV